MGVSRRDENGFTPTQAVLWDVLRDCNWHNRKELYAAMDHHDRTVLKQHVAAIRAIVASKGILVMYVYGPFGALGVQIARRLMPMEIG